MVKMSEPRKDIGLHDTGMDLLMTMSEGNPGALRVLSEMLTDPIGFMQVLSLDDMNIRGTQIWVGYKDYCGEDILKFRECVKTRDPGMVEAINNEGRAGNHTWMAVTSGASFKGGRKYL
jgi:hypothetical protein